MLKGKGTCGECPHIKHCDICDTRGWPECPARTNERELLKAQQVVAQAMGETIAEESLEKALLQEQNAEMLKALEAAEWGGVSGITTRGKEYKECSVCWGNTLDGHAPDCILASALKKAKGE